jgi:protein AroM
MSKEGAATVVAMITIGQSPRSDVTSDVEPILGEHIQIVECGALDDLDERSISELKPRDGEEVLVTRLRDGTEVQVSHERIVNLVNDCIYSLEKKAGLVVLLCTGEFRGVHSEKLLIMPSDLLFRVVQSLLPRGRAGVLIPSPAQVDAIRTKWAREGLEVFIQALSPYQEADESAIREVSRKFLAAKVDLIVLDCIGYSNQLSREMKHLTGLPVVLARTIVARVLKEIL